MSGKVVCLVERPSHVYVDDLDEDARSLPLHIDERIDYRAVAILFLVLVMEHSEYRVVCGRIPFCSECSVESDLHLHDFLHDVKLIVVSEVEGQQGQRHHIRIG